MAISCSLSNIMRAFLVLLLISLDPFLRFFYKKGKERMGKEERVWEPN